MVAPLHFTLPSADQETPLTQHRSEAIPVSPPPVTLAAVHLLAPEPALANPCPSSESLSSVNLIRPLHFQVFRSFLRQKPESLLDFNNCQAPVRILLKLSTFRFYLPLNLRSLTRLTWTFLYCLYFSLHLPSLIVPLLPLYVHFRVSGQSVSPDTLADVLDVNMFPPGRPDCGLPSLLFHQRSILMFCVPPSGSFQCSTMFPQICSHSSRL